MQRLFFFYDKKEPGKTFPSHFRRQYHSQFPYFGPGRWEARREPRRLFHDAIESCTLLKKDKNEGEDNRHNNTRSLGNKGLKMSLTSRLRCLVVSINWEALASSIVTTSPSRHTRAARRLCVKEKTRVKEKNHNKSVERGFLELSARPQHLRRLGKSLYLFLIKRQNIKSTIGRAENELWLVAVKLLQFCVAAALH